jgi:hypothetical protein
MTAGGRLVKAAEGLLGCRFRLYGRDPATGLDCVGLLVVALEQTGVSVKFPLDYTLKGKWDDRIWSMAERAGLVLVEGPAMAGDVLLVQVGPCQLHLVICADGGAVVHAHAGLRRVLRSPERPEGTIAAHWRLLHS